MQASFEGPPRQEVEEAQTHTVCRRASTCRTPCKERYGIQRDESPKNGRQNNEQGGVVGNTRPKGNTGVLSETSWFSGRKDHKQPTQEKRSHQDSECHLWRRPSRLATAVEHEKSVPRLTLKSCHIRSVPVKKGQTFNRNKRTLQIRNACFTGGAGSQQHQPPHQQHAARVSTARTGKWDRDSSKATRVKMKT